MLITGLLLMLLLCLPVVDVLIVQPQRVEGERKARRDAPSKLVRPSQRVDTTERKKITAFRAEEWRLKPQVQPTAAPADFYLTGYLLVQEAEEKLAAGDAQSAKLKFTEAAKVFQALQERVPEFEPSMVGFRTRKIEKSLLIVEELLQRGPKPQSSIEAVEDEMQFASK